MVGCKLTGSYTSLDTPDERYREGAFTYYYQSGNKSSEGFCLKGKSSGEWASYFDQQDHIESKLYYVNGLKEGTGNFYDSASGIIRSTGSFIHDKRNGYWTYFYNGTTHKNRVMAWFNDSLSGVFTWYDSTTGIVTRLGEFVCNKACGKFIYYCNGSDHVNYIYSYVCDTVSGTQIFFDRVSQKVLQIGRLKMLINNSSVVLPPGVLDSFHDGRYIKCRDSLGRIVAEGTIVDGRLTGPWRYYDDDDGHLVTMCSYDWGLYQGYYTSYYPNGILKRQAWYNGGGKYWGNCFRADLKKATYTIPYILPLVTIDLKEYFYKELHYPEKAKKDKVKGNVCVGFLIDKKGYASNYEVYSGLSEECDKEALRVVKGIPDWIPGLREGKPSSFFYTLQVEFKPPQ